MQFSGGCHEEEVEEEEEEEKDEDLAVEVPVCPELAKGMKMVACGVKNFKTAFDNFQTRLSKANDDMACQVREVIRNILLSSFRYTLFYKQWFPRLKYCLGKFKFAKNWPYPTLQKGV